MRGTDDEIREKYLERAIRELNHFTRDLQACDRCPRGSLMPVLGSGHPQADIIGKQSSLYYAQVQALKFLQTKVAPPAARRRTVRKAAAGRNR